MKRRWRAGIWLSHRPCPACTRVWVSSTGNKRKERREGIAHIAQGKALSPAHTVGDGPEKSCSQERTDYRLRKE